MAAVVIASSRIIAVGAQQLAYLPVFDDDDNDNDDCFCDSQKQYALSPISPQLVNVQQCVWCASRRDRESERVSM